MLTSEGKYPDAVFIDPPRKGAGEDTISSIAQLKPKRVVYISCDSATLARDAVYLREHGYMLIKATPVDMFPRTANVETAALFVKR
jgi:23S rRNA (uracil1939-C5)-methyltransferase